MTQEQCTSKTTCGLLASGGLGFTLLKLVFEETKLNFVLTDRSSEAIWKFCRAHSVPVFVGNPRTGDIREFLSKFETELVLSINYLFIVEKDVLEHPSRLAVNFHGSLLPRYRGRTPHVWAIINNEIETGITAHVMNEGCDTGDILLQRKIPIASTDTGATILQQFGALYPVMVRKLLQDVQSGTWELKPQDHSRASYFGKRTPEDGRIEWHWQRERIHNWIRAQASPYPGAFFVVDGERHHVNRSQLSDFGFNSEQSNGAVLSLNPLIVKTPNGAIQLDDHSFEPPHNFTLQNDRQLVLS